MPSEEQQEILQELAALRRDVHALRRWIIFTAICVGLLLFGPILVVIVVKLSGTGNSIGGYLAPIASVTIVIVLAAIIVSHFAAPPAKEPREIESPDPPSS